MPATDTEIMAPARPGPVLPPIEGPSAWVGADLRGREAEWRYRLSPPEIAEIQTAVQAVRACGLDIAKIRREDFRLPTLGPVLDRLRAAGVTGLRLALPRPGDPLGLKGPAAFNQAAIAAGEAVLTDGPALGVVPAVDGYGPAGDRGHVVRWTVTPVQSGEAAVPTLSEAERELNAALRDYEVAV